jgi:2-polyprenyl-3-methyl-5-hydroxy-6-metoxy-1,4-benzoquinol methylase
MTGYPEVVWTQEMTARFWAFESTRPENFFSFQVGPVLERRFRKHLAGKTILDYGAGSGHLVECLLSRGYQCGAVEPSGARELTTKFSRFPNFLGATETNVNTQFDVVFLIEVVEHVYDRELTAILNSIRGTLKPGGLLILTTPNDEDRSKQFIMSPESGKLFHRFQHVRSWTKETLADALSANGFSLEVTEVTDVTDFGASFYAMQNSMSAPLRIARTVAKKIIPRKPPHLYALARVAA